VQHQSSVSDVENIIDNPVHSQNATPCSQYDPKAKKLTKSVRMTSGNSSSLYKSEECDPDEEVLSYPMYIQFDYF
jgi:hypothetical protein